MVPAGEVLTPKPAAPSTILAVAVSQIGASALAAEDTETGVNLSSQVGGTSNIAIKADGQYKIDLKYNAENSEYSVEITRLGDATAEFPWEYDQSCPYRTLR